MTVIVPPLILPGMDQTFVDGVDDGPAIISRDGSLFSLPAGSGEILVIQEGL